MKAKISTILLIVCMSSFLNESYVRGQAVNQDQETVAMLTNFYTIYIHEYSSNDDVRIMELNIDSLLRKHCTANLLDKINKDIQAGNLNYDPFINAQDANADSINSLSINVDVNNANIYVVSYIDSFSKKKISIKLTVLKTADGPKIDSIL